MLPTFSFTYGIQYANYSALKLSEAYLLVRIISYLFNNSYLLVKVLYSYQWQGEKPREIA